MPPDSRISSIPLSDYFLPNFFSKISCKVG